MIRRLALLALPVAALIVAVGGGVAWQFHRTERASAELQADILAKRVEDHVEGQILLLDAVRGLMEENGVVSVATFDRFLERISVDGRADGMVGIGYTMMSPTNASDAASAAVLRNYGLRPVQSPTDQPLRSTIILLSPLDDANRRALGFDMYSEARRRAAMDRAWTSGETATSDIVALVQDRGRRPGPGFLIYQPLYAERSEAGVRMAGRRPLQGFVYAPYRTGDLFAAAVGRLAERGSGVTIRAADRDNAPIVYAAGRQSGSTVILGIRVGDRRFRLEYRDPRLDWNRGTPAMLFFGSIVAALLVGALLTVLARRAESLATLAEERAGRAQDKDLLLAEMAHRLKNSYARIAALISMTAREHATAAEFAPVLRGRVHALADSVALLTTGIGGAAGITSLLAAELHRAQPDLDIASLSCGPDVLLDEQEAQAVALVIHELATNSVKYGALGGNGRLDVAWHVWSNGLRLDWTESALSPPPVLDREGFGSQFLRTIVTRQLRGAIERTVDGDTLRITLDWPREMDRRG